MKTRMTGIKMNQYNSAAALARDHAQKEKEAQARQSIALEEKSIKQKQKAVEDDYKARGEKREKMIIGISVAALLISLISLIVAIVK